MHTASTFARVTALAVGIAGALAFSHADAAAFQLLPCLQEIAAIRPQTRPVRRHHQRTCAAREAGNIVPPAEVRADVLRRVEIIRGDDLEVDAVRLHGAAKLQ